MNSPTLLAAIYLAQLGLKAGLALSYGAREARPSGRSLERLTVLQPVTSGDEQLEQFLTANAAEPPEAALIWVVDRSDAEALRLCRLVAANFPLRLIRIVAVDEPAPGFNPKLWKQVAGLPLVQTEIVAVVDDDTRVPRRSYEQLVEEIDRGATLATGLPCYVPARGAWSRMLAEFVNSAAILTYLPAAATAPPRAINGMCYALRTEFVRAHNLFAVTGRSITDDLAIAKEVVRLGGKIVQTAQPQYISTSVQSFTHYRRLMHRWFVATRILVQCESIVTQAILFVLYVGPPFLLLALAAKAVGGATIALVALASTLIVRSATLVGLNRWFTKSFRHAPFASLFNELALPGFLAVACCYPIIWWRRRRIRVRGFATFEYLPS